MAIENDGTAIVDEIGFDGIADARSRTGDGRGLVSLCDRPHLNAIVGIVPEAVGVGERTDGQHIGSDGRIDDAVLGTRQVGGIARQDGIVARPPGLGRRARSGVAGGHDDDEVELTGQRVQLRRPWRGTAAGIGRQRLVAE